MPVKPESYKELLHRGGAEGVRRYQQKGMFMLQHGLRPFKWYARWWDEFRQGHRWFLFKHIDKFKNRLGQRVLTCQPYNPLDRKDLNDLKTFTNRNGFRVVFSNDSWHMPGLTYMIKLVRDQAPPVTLENGSVIPREPLVRTFKPTSHEDIAAINRAIKRYQGEC
jgi:hypothetical protein